MFANFDVAEGVRSIFGRHADKTEIVAYHQLAELTIEKTEPDCLQKAFNLSISPEQQGMVLALLAARACALGLRNPDTQIVFEAFNKHVFKRILGREADMNAVEVPQEITEIKVINPDGSDASTDGLDVRALGEMLKRIAAGTGGERQAIFAWFDHHVYTAALKTLGARVPDEVAAIVAEHKQDMPKDVDLRGLMKDDLIPLMADDAAAYLHRCHLYVRHQTPARGGPTGGISGITPTPGGFIRFTVL